MFSSVIGAAKVRPVGQDGNIDEGADEGNGRQDHRSCSHIFSTIISATTLAGNQRCSDKNEDGPYDHPGERENRHNYVNDLDEHCLETRRSNEVILVESIQEKTRYAFLLAMIIARLGPMRRRSHWERCVRGGEKN